MCLTGSSNQEIEAMVKEEMLGVKDSGLDTFPWNCPSVPKAAFLAALTFDV